MKKVIEWCCYLALFQVGTALTIKDFFDIGEVDALTEFQFHNKASGMSVSTSIFVDSNLTQTEVDDFLLPFDPTKETIIITHGWLNNDKKPLAKTLIEAYLSDNDYNIFFVNWSPEAYQLYKRSVEAVPKIADNVVDLVIVLVSNYGAILDKIHLVGHSLGAHIVGIAGIRISSAFQGLKVGRITGLDPAHPMFDLSMTERLRPESAKFVDVIHTCSNILAFADPLGHVDFSPNGGQAIQPGCGWRDIVGGKCSHGRSYEYFAESINNPKAFLATECDSYDNFKKSLCDDNQQIYMGESVLKTARGSYFLNTNKISPYGKGDAV